jgi:hypothetical protein
MRIVRNEAREKELVDQLLLEANTPRPDNMHHVTALIHPLVTYWAITDPRPHDKSAAMFFVVGRAVHGVFEPYFAKEPEKREVRIKLGDITGTIDAIDADNAAVELKGTRKRSIPDEPDDRYVEQCAAYCAMSNRLLGRIAVVYLAPHSYVPEVRIHDLIFSEQELNIIRVQLEMNLKALTIALEKKDPSILRQCPSTMCLYCKWKDVCDGATRLERL